MISVVIPALNEESALRETLDSVCAAAGNCEIIVSDGGSTDATRAIAARYGPVVTATRGRSSQMNRGAAAARGDILLFLHADVLFPKRGLTALENALTDRRVVGGNFDIVYEGSSFTNRLFTLINHGRRPLGIFYGDSGIFVRRSVFEALGGFRPLPLMEDYDFARRLIRRGRTICLRQQLTVSARRWEEFGLLRTCVAWFLLHAFYYLGIPPRWWGRLYPNIRRSQPTSVPAVSQAISRAISDIETE
jgi:rSAM/selenodomain-associated transferase 2